MEMLALSKVVPAAKVSASKKPDVEESSLAKLLKSLETSKTKAASVVPPKPPVVDDSTSLLRRNAYIKERYSTNPTKAASLTERRATPAKLEMLPTSTSNYRLLSSTSSRYEPLLAADWNKEQDAERRLLSSTTSSRTTSKYEPPRASAVQKAAADWNKEKSKTAAERLAVWKAATAPQFSPYRDHPEQKRTGIAETLAEKLKKTSSTTFKGNSDEWWV